MTHDIKHVESRDIGAWVLLDGETRIAEMAYRRLGDDAIVIEHTRVDESLRGQGVARQLLDTAVAWARSTKTRVHATCPYAKAQLEKDASIQDVYEP